MRLGPARVHARQHLRPVLRLGAAGAGMDFDEAVIAVRLAGEQALDLHPGRAVAQREQGGLGLGDDLAVVLGLAELDELAVVPHLAVEGSPGGQRAVEPRALAHDVPRAFGVVPERRVLDEPVQLRQPGLGAHGVKDASSAAQATARSRRGRIRFPRACRTAPGFLADLAGAANIGRGGASE